MTLSLPVTAIAARDPLAEARAVAGIQYGPRVLEPAPPAVTEAPWWADDPVDPTPADPGRQVISPVHGLGDVTWSTWASSGAGPVRDAWLRNRWLARHRRLGQAPHGYVRTRTALHRVAVCVLSPGRQGASESKMALRFTRGGFGTPFFGADEQLRVEGSRLIRQRARRRGRCPSRRSTAPGPSRWVADPSWSGRQASTYPRSATWTPTCA